MDVHVRTFAPSVVVALLVAAYLLFGVPDPPAAMAAGGEIEVLETHQQVNYPLGVGLSITVESEAEIAEVRVYYRAAGSRQWGYAYADFDPGTRVVATQSIPVREATYIAPGANVEYYFEVRDVAGNVVKTDRAVVEYLDGRFDWRRVSIGPLELVYHDISDSRVEETARALRQDLERVRELLQLDQVRSFKGVVYNSYADANAAFPRAEPDHYRPRHFRRLCFPGAAGLRRAGARPAHHSPRVDSPHVPGRPGKQKRRSARLAE